MSDFADGIAPRRYACRQSKELLCREERTRASPKRASSTNRQALHWSLDEGRWILREPKDGDGSVVDKTTARPNAFVRFKRFVDTSFGTVNFAKRRRDIEGARQRLEQDAWMKWAGQAGRPDPETPAKPRSEAVKAATRLLQMADLTQDAEIPFHKLQLLFQDDAETRLVSREDPWLAAGGAWYFLPEVGDRLPLPAALVRSPPPAPPQWLTMDWFKRSPYSPIQVEAVDNLVGPRERWRAAFEDLMLISLDRPICSHSALGRPLKPGIDWVLDLQIRSILPPLLPSLYSSQAHGKIVTTIMGRPRQHDYQEFSDFVDEIWKSDRSTRVYCCARQLRMLRKPLLHKSDLLLSLDY